jgi:hypothetical protein
MQLDKNDSPNTLLKTEQNVSLPTNILNSDVGLTPQSLQAFNAGKAADINKYTQDGVIPKFDLEGVADGHAQTHDFSPPVKDRLDYANRHNKDESNPIKNFSGGAAGASGGGAAGSGECNLGAAAGKHPPESDGTTIEITVNHGNVILNDGTTHDGNLVFKGDAK